MNYSFNLFIYTFVKSYIYVVLLPSKLLNEKKYVNYKAIASALTIAVILNYMPDINFVIKAILTVILNFIVIALIYRKGNVISLIMSLIGFTIVFICDEITEVIFVKLFNVDLIYISYYTATVMQMTLTLFLLSVIFCCVLRAQSLFEELKEYRFERKNMNIIFIYIIFSILFLALIGYRIKTEEFFRKDYIIGVMLLIIYVITSSVYLIQIKELIRSKNDYDTIYNYISNVEKVAGQLKKQEHEHDNQLIAIKAFAQEKKSEETINFIDNILKNKIKNKISANVGLDKIQDSILKTLLVHKINSATGFGLRVEAFIRKEILPVNNISPKDMANIIGIIMDNAIEGANESEQKYISILIDEDEDSEELNITISNTYNEIPKIYEAGRSTKGEYRGNGLSILEDIEEENERIKISTELTEELFIQDIFIKI